MNIATAAAFYRAANGKRVRRTIEGQPVLDNWAEKVADVRRQLLEQGCPESDIEEDSKSLTWPGGFLLKPRQYRQEEGTLNIRSSSMLFTNPLMRDGAPIVGDKKGSRVEEGRLVRDLPNGARVTFELMEEVA